MTVFCGPSGSGKSSLAMDTIYAEGQRRYVESLQAYARQFVGQMQKPPSNTSKACRRPSPSSNRIWGTRPVRRSARSTEIYDYLRILFARLGTPHCPSCDRAIGTQSADEIIAQVLSAKEGTCAYLLAPIASDSGTSFETLWRQLQSSGYQRVRVDGTTYALDAVPEIDRRRHHQVEAVVDRITIRRSQRGRLAESIEIALGLGQGVIRIAVVDEDLPETEWRVETHSRHLACHECGRSFETLTPHNFSFNSPLGWCPECDGLGVQTGTDPAALIAGSEQSLAQGAMLLWPRLSQPLACEMLRVLSRRTGIPLDTPWNQLSARHRRLLLHGTGDRWFEVGVGDQAVLKFQFKGLYPAIEETVAIVAGATTAAFPLVGRGRMLGLRRSGPPR